MADAYLYFPGCFASGGAAACDTSMRGLAQYLQVELRSAEGLLSCCGGSPAREMDEELSLALIGRNLQEAYRTGLPLLLPDACCYRQFMASRASLRKENRLRALVEANLGRAVSLEVEMEHPLSLLTKPVFLDKIRDGLRRKFPSLRPVAYYGAELSGRLMQDIFWERQPQGSRGPIVQGKMERLLEAIGLQPIEWKGAVLDHGALSSFLYPKLGRHLVGKIIAEANRVGANAILCAGAHAFHNLELHQTDTPPLPVFFITELLALALELPQTETCLASHLIEGWNVL